MKWLMKVINTFGGGNDFYEITIHIGFLLVDTSVYYLKRADGETSAIGHIKALMIRFN